TKYYMSFSGLWGDEKQEEWIPLDVELYDDLLVMRHHNTSHSIPVKPGSLAGNVAISLSGDPENSDALQVRNFDVQPMLARGGGMTLEGFESSVAQATADLETKKSREKALQRLWELRYQSASVTPVPDRKTLQQLGQLIDKNDPQESRRHQVMGSIAKMAAQQDAKDRKAGRNALADARMRWFAGLAPDLVGATVSGPVVEAAAPPPELTWTALDMDEVFKDLDKEGWVRSGDGVEAPAPKKELTDIWATSSVSVTGNVRITAQVQFEGSTGFGMHFGDKSSSDFRTLSINGFDNKSVTTSYFTGKWNPKKEGKIDINSVNHTVGLKEFHEGPVTVSVELIGNTVAVTVDGQPTQVYTLDSPLKPGPIGFFVLPYFGDEEEGPGTVRIPSLTIETAP
ncbi:MAG: hypothetical protein R3E96_17605, partial [Planctomycetota bacterium]